MQDEEDDDDYVEGGDEEEEGKCSGIEVVTETINSL